MSLFQLQILLPKMLNVRFPTFLLSAFLSLSRPFMFTILHCIIPPLHNGFLHLTQWLFLCEGMAAYGVGNGCFVLR